MLRALKSLLQGSALSPQAGEHDGEPGLRLAVALLLLDVARADSKISGQERRVAQRLLERFFGLSPEQAADLAAVAQQHAEHETSLFPFTRRIRQECGLEERSRIVDMLWELSCADGVVDPHEEHLVRKVAGLLYVPHSRYIKAKLRHIAR